MHLQGAFEDFPPQLQVAASDMQKSLVSVAGLGIRLELDSLVLALATRGSVHYRTASSKNKNPQPDGGGSMSRENAGAWLLPLQGRVRWSLELPSSDMKKLQVQPTGRKRANSIGANLAVGESIEPPSLKKNVRRGLRQLYTTSRAGQAAGARSCGARISHRGGNELEVIDRPIARLHRNGTGGWRLPWNGDHTNRGWG